MLVSLRNCFKSKFCSCCKNLKFIQPLLFSMFYVFIFHSAEAFTQNKSNLCFKRVFIMDVFPWVLRHFYTAVHNPIVDLRVIFLKALLNFEKLSEKHLRWIFPGSYLKFSESVYFRTPVTVISRFRDLLIYLILYESSYSRTDQIKFVEDSL